MSTQSCTRWVVVGIMLTALTFTTGLLFVIKMAQPDVPFAPLFVTGLITIVAWVGFITLLAVDTVLRNMRAWYSRILAEVREIHEEANVGEHGARVHSIDRRMN